MKAFAKRLLPVFLVLLIIISLAACTQAPPAATTAPPATQAPAATTTPAANVPKSIKIGFVASLTGAQAASGMYCKNGWVLYLKQNDQKLGGIPIEYIVEDNASDPAVAVTKAQKLCTSDKVDFIIGGTLASEAYAIAPIALENKIPYISLAAADSLSQHDFNKYMFRVTWTGSQPMYPFADYLYNEAGIKTIAAVANDYAFQYEQLGGFKIAYDKLGGKIKDIQWVPLTGKDFGAYVAAIPDDVDAVYSGIVGGNGPGFLQEMANYGVNKDKVILASGASTDEAYLDSIGDAGIGVLSALQYSTALGTPACDAWVDAYKKEYGAIPDYYGEGAYVAGIALDQAFKALIEAGKDVKDIDAFTEVWQKMKIDAPKGPMAFDQFNQAIMNIYIRKIEKANGKYGTYQNTVLKTYPMCDQWGPFKTPEERMKTPMFNKEYPFNS